MNARDSLLVAQLSQATISFLGLLNRLRREDPRACKAINRLLIEANYNPVNSLVNQGTLIGHAYLTIVWLWEKQATTFANAIPDREIGDPIAPWPNLADTVLVWNNGLKRVSARSLPNWLRHVRNALSHGRVSFDETANGALLLLDAMPERSEAHTRIRIDPLRLAEVSDLVVQACVNASNV